MIKLRRKRDQAPKPATATASGSASSSNLTPMAPPNSSQAGLFQRVAGWTIRFTGGRWGFTTAMGIVLIWLITGPIFHYTELWQLVINTGTSVVTFLMVFLIQNAQNRESKAVHLKLDELIYAARSANNSMMSIENLTDEQLDMLAERYHRVAARHHRFEGDQATDCEPASTPKTKTAGANSQVA
ncbi:MAG TPA: low affinity iron permease family protein [Isosphaeraceae bacterium]|jgi:low affinity Fe/Cu permease|nr:low affinity iron permease family protein [Isosphaeraceae bacterium]